MTYSWKTVAAVLLSLTCGLAAYSVAGETPAGTDKPSDAVRPPTHQKDPAPCRTDSNVIIIDNGGRGSSTVIDNSANGAGKRLVVVDGKVIDDSTTPSGKALKWGDLHFYSPLHQCTLYWGPKTLTWYRYDRERQEYVPVVWD